MRIIVTLEYDDQITVSARTGPSVNEGSLRDYLFDARYLVDEVSRRAMRLGLLS